MPLYLSIPLPGPFRYSTRIGGRRRRRSHRNRAANPAVGQALFWILIGWWAVPTWLLCKYTVVGTVWLCRYGYGQLAAHRATIERASAADGSSSRRGSADQA